MLSLLTSNQVVIDTNVLFEGLTKQGGASGLVIDAWLVGLVDVYVSNALAYKYVDVLSRKLKPQRWQRIKPVYRLFTKRSRIYCHLLHMATQLARPR